MQGYLVFGTTSPNVIVFVMFNGVYVLVTPDNTTIGLPAAQMLLSALACVFAFCCFIMLLVAMQWFVLC